MNAVVGFYYQHTFRHFDQRVFFANSANSAAADPANQYVAYNKISHTTDNTYSGYGELQWAITDALKLTGGARYISEEKVSSFIQPYVNPAFLGLFLPWPLILEHVDLRIVRVEPAQEYGAF